MGESIVDPPEIGNKMGVSAAPVGALEASVSFGRFVNDSLSWERWSSFSPNKYLEEVEKCSTPGSVAQKKAYFEAHYKKIAARKAELLNQEKQMKAGSSRPEESNSGDLSISTGGTDAECDMAENQKSPEVVEQDTNGICAVSSCHIEDEYDEPSEDAAVTKEFQSPSVESTKEEFDSRPDSLTVKKSDEADSLKEYNYPVGPPAETELQWKLGNGIGNTSEVKAESVRLDPPKESQKVTLINKVGHAVKTKKKSASPVPKSPQMTTPRVSKPASSSIVKRASRSSTRKDNSSSLPRSNNPSVHQSKKAGPSSLHMSLNLGGSTNATDSAFHTTTRKSFIMDKMGDKDIVKRAFKTFQSNYNQLKTSGEERSSDPKQVSAKGTRPRVSTSMAPRKENGRSLKADSVDQRHAKGSASSFSLRSDERAEKRKVVSSDLSLFHTPRPQKMRGTCTEMFYEIFSKS
ncbi:protein WVD2-like 7 isoform X2 [Malania oleifera]|uniref:protein WVD2-like 7 isoform X2 n=1 Tax=Malania oleifera TaxID=397392 RepID=UPI0025AE0A1F|nr:protein WVD2-like 7 isoform X2 [Malania oleifera]